MHMQPEEAEEARIRLVWKRWKVEHGAMHREGDRPMRMTLVVERTIPIHTEAGLVRSGRV
jgi:hypothetical protein